MGIHEESVINWVLDYVADHGLVFDKSVAGDLLNRKLKDDWVHIAGFGDD